MRSARVTRHFVCLALRVIGYADVRSGIVPPQSTNSPGANSDSRKLAFGRLERKGESHGGDEQSHPSRYGISVVVQRFAFPLGTAEWLHLARVRRKDEWVAVPKGIG